MSFLILYPSINFCLILNVAGWKSWSIRIWNHRGQPLVACQHNCAQLHVVMCFFRLFLFVDRPDYFRISLSAKPTPASFTLLPPFFELLGSKLPAEPSKGQQLEMYAILNVHVCVFFTRICHVRCANLQLSFCRNDCSANFGTYCIQRWLCIDH